MNTVSRMRRNLFCTSVLSGGLMLVAVPEVMAECVDTIEQTICSDGSLIGQNVSNNIITDTGDYYVWLDNFQIRQGGVRAFGVRGNTEITLVNASQIQGVTTQGMSAGIWVDNYFSGDISVSLLDTSSVSGLDGVFAISRRGIGVPGSISVTSEEGSIVGTYESGIRVYSDNSVFVDVGGDVSGFFGSGIHAGSSYEKVFVRTGTGKIFSQYSTAISAFSTFGEVEISTGGVVEGENGISTYGQGLVSVTTAGAVNGLTGFGISAGSYGTGDVHVTTLSDVFGVSNGISAYAEKGTADIKIESGIITSETQEGVFLNGSTASTLTNNGTIRGLEHGVLSYSMGANVINNNGLIANLSMAKDGLAIGMDYSAATLTNSASGKILGRVEFGADDFDDSFTNQGLWQSTGLSEFGAGVDVLSNGGVVRFSGGSRFAESTSFSGLETFENAGLLSGMDQASKSGSTAFDSLGLSGDYIGAAGAVLAFDVYLGGPGSLADVLTVDGNTSGRTLVRLNNTNAGSGAINEAGIVLVDVAGTSSADDFALEGGPVTSGLYAYDLEYRAREAGASFALVSAPSAQAGELVELVDGLQNIWTGGMNAWSLRQATLRDAIAGRTRITAVSSDGMTENAAVQQVWAAPRGEWSKRDTAGTFGSTAHRQITYGLDGGVDFAVDVAPDAQLMFGLVGGYATSHVNYLDSASGIDIEGGSLGAYAGFVSQGFFADALLKHDWMELDYTAAGAGSAKTEARSLGLAADVGYRFESGLSFIEPLVSLSTIKTQADDFTLGGTLVSSGKNVATRVGAGVRFGVNEGVFNSLFTLRAWESLGGENQLSLGAAAIPIVGSSSGTTFEFASQLSVDVSEHAKVFVNGTTNLSDDETAASLTAGLTAQF